MNRVTLRYFAEKSAARSANFSARADSCAITSSSEFDASCPMWVQGAHAKSLNLGNVFASSRTVAAKGSGSSTEFDDKRSRYMRLCQLHEFGTEFGTSVALRSSRQAELLSTDR